MSLINQMLNDLESHRGYRGAGEPEILADVTPVDSANNSREDNRLKILWLSMLIGISAAVLAWFVLQSLGPRWFEQSKLDAPAAPAESLEHHAQITQNTVNRLLDALISNDLNDSMPEAGAVQTAQSGPQESNPIATPAKVEKPLNTPAAELKTAQASVDQDAVDNELSQNDMELALEPAYVEAPLAPHGNTARVSEKGSIEKAPLAEAVDPDAELREIVGELKNIDNSSALAAISDFVEEHPANVLAREAYATALLRAKRVADAEKVLRNGLHYAPNESRYALMLAHLLVARGELEAAVDTLSIAVPNGPAANEHFAFIAALQQRLGQHRDAIDAYQRALAGVPDRGAWWVGLGISLTESEQGDSATEAFRRALSDRSLSENLRRFARREIGRLSNG